jgi:hypothetical protein
VCDGSGSDNYALAIDEAIVSGDGDLD